MARVIVSVMPKPEILDPQGKAVHKALPRLGFTGVTDVRQGKRFELEVEGEVTDARLAEIHDAGREAAVQPGHRGLRGRRPRGRPFREDRRRHLPGLAGRRRRRPRRTHRRRRAGPRSGTATTTLRGVDAVMLPGGFSYGDYLRCGAIARFAPVMTEIVEGARAGPARPRHLQRLPDPLRVAPAARRADPQRPPQVRVRRPAAADREQPHGVDLASTPRAPRSRSSSRTARAASSASEATLDLLEGEGRVVARYLGGNPNGSLRDIAGITNERGNVVGLMPHPEHAVEDALRPRHRRARRSSPRCSSPSPTPEVAEPRLRPGPEVFAEPPSRTRSEGDADDPVVGRPPGRPGRPGCWW